MNLNFKKSVNNVFSLKYFWIYLFFAAVVTTLSSILQSAKEVPFHNSISNFISIFSYISTGYLLIVINNLLHENNLNNDNENFWQNLWNSTKKGLKYFLGSLANMIIVFSVGAIIAISAVLIFMAVTHNTVTENNIFTFWQLKLILGCLAIILSIFMLFILKLLPIAYAENFSIKDMFCWKKVFKTFFQKGKTKTTLAILGIYILFLIAIFLTMFLIMFIVNLLFVYTIKTLLTNNYVAAAFLINLSGVITPFFAATAHFILISIVYNMLAYTYKN